MSFPRPEPARISTGLYGFKQLGIGPKLRAENLGEGSLRASPMLAVEGERGLA